MLLCGFSRLDISPGTDLTLVGYAFRNTDLPPGNDGVHDPLHARVLALRDGQGTALLASVDLCWVPQDLSREIRKAMAERVGIDASRVILSATHTHSGPLPLSLETACQREGLSAEDAVALPQVVYGQYLKSRLVDAAARANGHLFPVEAYAQEAPLGLAYDRRIHTSRGIEHCWGPQRDATQRPDLAADPTCNVLVLQQSNGPRRCLLWSLGAHPVVMGQVNRSVSADYPGLANHLLEEYLPGCRPMFCLGAAGHAHPWIATQEDTALLLPVARAAASFVALLTQGTRPVADPQTLRLQIAAETVNIASQDLDVAIWRLGEQWIVVVPVELFDELGLDLRRRLGGHVILATVSNGAHGYWPTAPAFDEGAYEVDIARRRGLAPGDGEKLVDALVALADSLR
jgi:hypothetical protein